MTASTPRYREISADELAGRLGTGDEPFVVDVREPDEFADWSITGAVNIPLGQFASRVTELPTDREVVTVCASGRRSSVAADLLAATGIRAANLHGGMAGWGAVYDQVVLELGDLRIVQVRRRGKGCLSYILGAGGAAAVVDPSRRTDLYTEVASEHGWHIAHVFDTHLHADHLSGARQLATATGAALHLNPADTFDFPYEPLVDGDRFDLAPGAHLTVAAVHTPGHTQGSTILFAGDRAALTGDTLFVDSVGRPDLADRAEEFARNLHASLHEKVLTLDDDALVLPAHYGDHVVVRPDQPVAATIGELRHTLPPLRMEQDAFVAWAVAHTTPRPPNYVEIVRANMGHPRATPSELADLEAGPNRCAV